MLTNIFERTKMGTSLIWRKIDKKTSLNLVLPLHFWSNPDKEPKQGIEFDFWVTKITNRVKSNFEKTIKEPHLVSLGCSFTRKRVRCLLVSKREVYEICCSYVYKLSHFTHQNAGKVGFSCQRARSLWGQCQNDCRRLCARWGKTIQTPDCQRNWRLEITVKMDSKCVPIKWIETACTTLKEI